MSKKSQKEIDFLGGKDSKDEVYFQWYVDDLIESGILIRADYHPETFTLFNPVRYTCTEKKARSTQLHTYSISQISTYTPDWRLQWDKSKSWLFTKQIIRPYDGSGFIGSYDQKKHRFYSQNGFSLIDVKPGFFKRSGDSYAFSLIRGAMLDKFDLNVQKVVIEDLFKHTFTPTRYLTQDIAGRPRKITEWEPISLETFLR